uniref:Calmodulin binding transcription activator 1 n=1 Tax=Xiphophorus couchianus TaxID=32473 RepID=A0A3B5M493_9TELE
MKPLLNILFCFALVVDEHGHLKIYLPKKLLECLPKCTSLPKERHRWNTNEGVCPAPYNLHHSRSPSSVSFHLSCLGSH